MGGKTRSPNHPAMPLPEAINMAQKLWDAEKRTAVDGETAAVALGFGGLNGKVRVMVGALRQYGFLAKGKPGLVQLSDLAINILHGGEEQRANALKQAALNPPVFKGLAQSHLAASETAIKLHLITTKGFSEDGALRAAKSFRATMALAKHSALGYHEGESDDTPEADMTGLEGVGVDAGKLGGAGSMSLSVPYSKGNIAIQVKVTGEALQPYHLARVRKYLALAEEDWEPESSKES